MNAGTLKDVANRLNLSVSTVSRVVNGKGYVKEETRQRVLDMLSGLTEQESKVVTMRFGLEDGKPLSAQEVGVKLGLTADQVVALESAALIKMRKEEENS